ncbi:MAG: protein-disulfide reductase DsbD [Chlorobiaceae bacterium]|nr:protein-disulfide reductase DsbD [Chlorobiaceae bacterium]
MRRSYVKHAMVSFMVFLFGILRATSALSADFLQQEQAFSLKAEVMDRRAISLHWDIANGYKLYRNGITATAEGGNAVLGDVLLPAGISSIDSSTGEKTELYHGRLDAVVPVKSARAHFRLKVTYQGCAEDGLCYPPVEKVFDVVPGKAGILSPTTETGEPGSSAGLSPAKSPATQQGSGGDGQCLAHDTLKGGNLWKIPPVFLLFGLLLSFTPCVLPMVPILSSIIVGDGRITKGKGFLLAVAYSLGMALVYTSLGVAAGLAGEGLAGALQKPWVLVMFSFLLIILSLSMFDVYQLQVPASLQNRLTMTSDRLSRGRFLGVFMMGSISALIVGPCVAAPLAGTLVYISQTRNVMIGGLALFSMAIGMSVPLLLIGLSAGSILPKVGPWMTGVKHLFGFVLIAVAIWMIKPVLPPQAMPVAWGALALFASVFIGRYKLHSGNKQQSPTFITIGVFLALIGVLEMIGAATGSEDPLKPFSWLQQGRGRKEGSADRIVFRRISSVEELDRELKSTDKPVMLDFYADWCISCKELEHTTFRDPAVVAKLSGMKLLQADVTANNEQDRALMKRFSLFGPPGIIIFDRQGREVDGARIVGFVDAAAFMEKLEKVR